MVALRKESVDRNSNSKISICIAGKVALRKESVDRNQRVKKTLGRLYRSLSARRAWIEINKSVYYLPQDVWSLSARRAWIEIVCPCRW